MEELQMIAFEIITNSGDATSNFLKAIRSAEEGNFEEADKCMEDGKAASLIAHKSQTKLIQSEVGGGEKHEMGILMVHAQDHLMNSILLRDLAGSFVKLHKKLDKVEA